MASDASAQRARMMLEQPVEQTIARLAVPTIISMLITSIYNMADTYFVSQIGTSASAAVGVIFSAMTIIQALSFTIGHGCGTHVSQALGAGDEAKARRFVATGFFTAFAVGVVIAAAGNLSVEPLVRFLGATDTIVPYARDYASYIFYAAPFMMGSLVMNNLLRYEGMALYGMIGMTSGGLINIVLDPILIFTLNLGTAGAAIATAVSQVISFVILLVMTNRRAGALPIRLRDFTPDLALYRKVLYNGMPSLGRQGIASAANIILNTAAGGYGDAAIAAMSIVGRIVAFINSTVIGFGQGFQPVCGFCYGAGRYDRVRRAYRFCNRVATVVLTVLAAAGFFLAEPLVTLFRRDDLQVIAIGTRALQYQLLTLPLWGYMTMSNMFTQSIGLGLKATLLAVSRQGIFLIPMLLLMPALWGLTGIQLAQPVADVLTLFFTLVIASRSLHAMMQRGEKSE